MDSLIDLVAQFEFYVFGATFATCVCLLTLAAARFVIKTVLAHTFPQVLRRVRRGMRTSEAGSLGSQSNPAGNADTP
jgi:hypothetical protein